MKNFRRIILASAMVVGTASFANATSIFGSCTSVSHATELNDPISCTKLNVAGLPVGAVVNDIILTVTGSISGSLSLTNNDSKANTGQARTDSAYNLGSALAGFTFTNNGFGNLFDTIFGTGVQTVPAMSTVNFTGLSSGNVSNASTNTTNFAPYEGAGSFNLTVTTLTSLVSNFGGGNVVVGQITNGTATATVQYDYTVQSGTPEPATMLLFGTGLMGLGMLRKRIKR